MTIAPDDFEPDRADSKNRPTRARFVVLGFLCAMTFVLYLDRVCMAQAAKPIQDEMSLTNLQLSYVHMAFTLAYGLFEIPTGHWGDVVGSRRVLTRIVVWWSVFTALTAACSRYVVLLAVRFVFGAGEAGAFPNAARVVMSWFPVSERGRIQGLINFSALFGGAVSPYVAAILISSLSWRAAFVVFGSLGLVWAAAFYLWYRDDPATHPAVNAAEYHHISDGAKPTPPVHGAIPWDLVVRNRNIWLLGTIMSCASFTSYLFFSWYPTYLQSARGLSLKDAGFYGSLVLAGGALGTLTGGYTFDEIHRRAKNRWRARGIFCFLIFSVAAAGMWLGSRFDSAAISAYLAALASFALHNQQPMWWSSAIEVSGKHTGALFGLMNGLGVFGAMGSQFFFGWFADHRRSQGFSGREMWDPAFLVYAAVLFVGACCWLFVDTSRSIDDKPKVDELL